MISFDLTENDRKVLDAIREESLIARKYARHYDEHEEEFPPDQLPEAKDRIATRVVDGRIWVFVADSKDWQEFLTTGEPAKSVTRIGAGPHGMTVKAPEGAVIDAWLAAQ